MPTEYGDVEYWDQRFSQKKESFDWLKTSEDFMPHIKAVVEAQSENLFILHIGSGSSNLGLKLCTLVRSPSQVHNVDFSAEAIQLGQDMEKAVIESPSTTKNGSNGMRMLWSQADLLDTWDIHILLAKNTDCKLYNLIVDKSTSDSIACCRDVDFDPITLDSVTTSAMASASQSDRNSSRTKARMMPVHLLALHMAAVTATDGHWLVLSYSEFRFDFLGETIKHHELPSDSSKKLLHPAKYWSLESKKAIERKETSGPKGAGEHVVYRPVTSDWLYILKRNDYPLQLNNVS